MPDRQLPARPNLEQYTKQAKDLARDCRAGDPDALARLLKSHPQFNTKMGAPDALPLSETWDSATLGKRVTLTDAQLVIAREHGFSSWPQFAAHITTLNLERYDAVDALLLNAKKSGS